MSLLATEGLTRHFAGLTAVDDVTFSLPPGRIRALIGPNGAGKTTFVSLLCGRIAPSAGRIWFRDKEITHQPAHARIRAGMAYTFQITSVFARLPALENVAIAGRAVGREAEAREALARVGLASEAHRPAGDLAYGHQRLLEIAMGLVQSPELLILDEPTQGLSDAEIADFEALIRALVPATTVLLIEHNMSVVMRLADDVTVLDRGRILAEGSPQAIRADHAVQAAYLGTG